MLLKNLDAESVHSQPINDFIKRTFDITFSIFAFIVLLPIFLIIAVWVKIDSDGPILFKQTRIGKNEKPFKIYKFRTMVTHSEQVGMQLTVGNDLRITKLGKILRAYKLDELPQLINIIKGEMSFVGPRPEVPKYTRLYKQAHKKVLTIRPGITDYASIKYRNESEQLALSENPEDTYIHVIMPDKLNINLQYLKKRSIFEDLKIIVLTIIKIIR